MSNRPYPMEPYWTALGKFVFEYAELEYAMHNVLRIALGITVKQSRTIFSGTRVRDAINLIRRHYEANRLEMDPWLEKAFPKIAELTTIRDKILHHGNLETPYGILASDHHKNHIEKAKGYMITTSDLKAMTDDAVTARGCLVMFWTVERLKRTKRYEGWREFAERPWRYKLPPSAHTPEGRKLIAQKHKLQPQA